MAVASSVSHVPARLLHDRAVPIIVAIGAILWWACTFHVSLLPAFLPWDFSWLWYLAFAFGGLWYVRGIRRGARQPAWRMALCALGAATIWAVLQTRFEYLAQHMFFMNRIQHVVMHHLGPFLIAVAWPWETIRAGMPNEVRALLDHPISQRVLRAFQQPEIACVVFVGLIALWLTPPVHFVAMINPALYQLMNWSMVVDGLLFWCVVLDPRPAAEARNSFAARAVMGMAVMFPQIAIGAIIAFANRDLYGFYAWCGRIYPTIDALSDQRIGGLIVWIPPAMMSVLSLILVLNNLRIDGERNAPPRSRTGISSASWTGR